MKLSVIIVNYNVKHFLEQCLFAVKKAKEGMEAEVFVVDNASVDGSAHRIKEQFPEVILIENHHNAGFSVANNQAIREAKGEYILLLNPDTIVEEDTFHKTVGFMESHPDAGGLGVKMINGKGRFLPESKRGLPTPWTAFYKIFGISALFPHSKRFGKYHMTYLDKDVIHPVEVLCGAFMLLRRSVLDKTGLLDESFFMYGEDIDLSYRILKAGYKNYYYPATTIIHYKGESTKKESISYVKLFYNAMIIFAKKHYSTGNARALSFFIRLAIRFRAFIAILQRISRRIYVPLLDAFIIYAGFAWIMPVWETVMFEPGYYPDLYMKWIVPCYILFWLTGIKLSGGYRKRVSFYRLERGLLWGTIALLIAYSLINEEFRFSRAMILIGSLWAMLILPAFRLLFNKLKIKGFELDIEKSRRIAIAGHPQGINRVRSLLEQLQVPPVVIGHISVSPGDSSPDYLGSVAQMKDIIRINRIEEIVFCAEDLSSGEIIRAMLDLTDLDVDYKIAPPASMSIIGSNSIHTAGDLYLVNINSITRPENCRKKRLTDILVAIMLIFTGWLLIWRMKNKKEFLKNIFMVLAGKFSWVGYTPGDTEAGDLPLIRKGVLHPGMLFGTFHDKSQVRQLNILYAKDYRLLSDLELIVRFWKNLDKPVNE